MGVKCVRQIYCCNETDLSHQSNNTQRTINQNSINTNKNNNKETILKKNSIFSVNSFANKFMRLETKMLRKPSKSINPPIIINNSLKFINELSQLTIIDGKLGKKSEKDIKMINAIFEQNYFIKSLSDQNKEDIMAEIRLAKITSNKFIIKEGFEGRFFYIIRNGLVEVIKNNKVLKSLSKGESFGEFALLNNSLRTCSIKSIVQCEFWILERISFRKIIDATTKENFKENKKFIKSVNFLKVLENYQISILCFGLYKEMFVENQIIANEGDYANCIYIIKEGEVNCVKEGRIIRTLYKGENFGERSIFVNSKRSLDLIAKTNCICYSISFEILMNILGHFYKDILLSQIIKMSFLKSEYFQKVNLNFIDRISKLFKMKNFNKNEIVYKKGNYMSEIVSVIIDGNLINKNKEIIGKRGDILFDKNLFYLGKDALIYDLFADPDCLICEAETNEILKILKIQNFQELIERSDSINILSNSQLLRKFHFDKIEEILLKMNKKIYKQNETIIKKGKEGKNIFFIKQGSAFVENNLQDTSDNTFGLKELGIYACIGENLLFSNYYNNTIITSSNCEILYINKTTFKEILGDKLINYLKKCLLLKDKNLNLRDFDFYGHFNDNYNPVVSLIKSKTNHQFYVIKSYIKDIIIKLDYFSKIEEFKKINLMIDYPFISNFIKIFQDRNFIYFLYEYIPGIELTDLINELNHPPFTMSQLRFYFANLLLIINYLHSKNIIHRSIQPNNILINANGYLNLISLKTAKKIEDRTNTIIGNLFYLAPEIITGEGYSFEADYWSVAVLMYELCFGEIPFNGNEDDPMSVYFSIINKKLSFPSNFSDSLFMSLLSNMLEKSPYKRYSRIELIQNHPWFKKFNFQDVEYLKINPEFIPNVEDILFESNQSFWKHSLIMYKDWQKNSGIIIDDNKRVECESWFEDF